MTKRTLSEAQLDASSASLQAATDPHREQPSERPDGYHHALRGRDPHRWRGVLSLLFLAVTWAIMTFVTSVVAVRIGFSLGVFTAEQVRTGQLPFGPLLLLSTNVSLASLIPASFFVQRFVYGQRVRFLHSMAGMFRWRLLPRTALVVVPLWLVYLLLSSLFDLPGSDYSGGVSLALLAVVLLTTPLQAAGEEYAFRGTVTRAVGAWFRSSRAALFVSIAVASLVFMASHASTDPWLIAYYFLFGVGMGLIAWRTDGLETSILVHAVNNVLTLAVVALFNNGAASTDRSEGTANAFALVPIAAIALTTVYVWVRSANSAGSRTELAASTGDG